MKVPAFMPFRVQTKSNFRKERTSQNISIVPQAHGIEAHRTEDIPRGHPADVVIADDTIDVIMVRVGKDAPNPFLSEPGFPRINKQIWGMDWFIRMIVVFVPAVGGRR